VGTADESGIADRLKAARARLGWSREELAVHSGISWSAIAQAESGRRRNLRPRTLSRLAAALGISIDYLVSGGPTPAMLTHQALLYDSDEGFAEGTGRFLLEGIERSEPGLALTRKGNLRLLRKRLGSDADQVELIEWGSRLSTPESVLGFFREFLNGKLQRGAAWVRIAGEPIWSGRSAAEIRLWTRHESLLNLTFAGSPLSLLCPYDARTVDPAVVAHARATHPQLIEGGKVVQSSDYRDPGSFALDSG
jgi:transcriptional regulator with XRE-family HTH domain